MNFWFRISLKEGNILSLTLLEYSLILTIIFLLAFLIIKHFSLRKLKSEQKELQRKSNILRQYNKATKSSNIISNSDLKGNITPLYENKINVTNSDIKNMVMECVDKVIKEIYKNWKL